MLVSFFLQKVPVVTYEINNFKPWILSKKIYSNVAIISDYSTVCDMFCQFVKVK